MAGGNSAQSVGCIVEVPPEPSCERMSRSLPSGLGEGKSLPARENKGRQGNRNNMCGHMLLWTRWPEMKSDMGFGVDFKGSWYPFEEFGLCP